jgi:hypothetical protein
VLRHNSAGGVEDWPPALNDAYTHDGDETGTPSSMRFSQSARPAGSVLASQLTPPVVE